MCLQKKQLLADLNELFEEINDVLMRHLSEFDITSVSHIVKIEERVKYVALENNIMLYE